MEEWCGDGLLVGESTAAADRTRKNVGALRP
jgi:hypothetical protein